MAQDKLREQIEQILEKKGISPKAATSEELMLKMLERLPKLIPKVMDRVMDHVIAEELERLGRSKPCRYWRKGACSKGIDPCTMDCAAYEPQRWWQQRLATNIKLTYALEGLLIGICVFAGITAFFSRELLLPLLFLYLAVVIMSRIQIIYQRSFLKKLTGL